MLRLERLDEAIVDAESRPASQNPDVIVVIPAYKQPGLLGEAIESVLNQKTALHVAMVVVDDGCPLRQTREVGQTYARAHPRQVYYVRRENGGLSAARNTGIKFALDFLGDFRALYFLDADNRLFPDFIQRTWAALQASGPEIGWIYPDVDMFGFMENYSTRGEYSVFRHLVENYCEAGSLVSRSVVDRGIRFDENMRHGFEDWDFWLQAASQGFRGRHLPEAGFQYRRRAESMLANSERARQSIIAYMRQKHRDLTQVDHLLALEASERPRFAIHLTDANHVEFVVDPQPAASQVLSLREDRIRFVNASLEPTVHHYPQFSCFGPSTAFDALKASKVIRSIFWQAQVLLDKYHAVLLRLTSEDRLELSVAIDMGPVSREDVVATSIVFVRTHVFRVCVLDNSSAWLRSLGVSETGPTAAKMAFRFRGHGEKDLPLEEESAVESLFRETETVRKLWQQRAEIKAAWRTDARMSLADSLGAYETFCNARHVFPHLASPDAADIGLILPLYAFGGVEKVVLNYALELRAHGFRPHLFITAAYKIYCDTEMLEAFESINFVDGDDVESASGKSRYFGIWTSEFGASARSSRLVGLLATMRAVLNTHSLGAHGVMARLRTLGVKTYLGLHLVERSLFNQPLGNPHVALAYEYAYDGIVVISKQMRAWCVGQGIPEDKVFVVGNAPSYATSPAKVASCLKRRGLANASALNVLFLGRLDFQKGLDRLASIVKQTRSPGIQWRVIGKAVLEDANDDLASLEAPIEPPAFNGAALDQLYQWADVVVLCSRFEGVPLTLLEAQRFGCVPLATDVGAVGEIVTDGVDGLLIDAKRPEEEIIADFVSSLQALANDRPRVYAIGTAAARRVADLGWRANLAGWLGSLRAALDVDASQ